MTGINNKYYYILSTGVPAVDDVTINVNTSALTAYISGGNAYIVNNPNIVPGSISFTVAGQTYTESDVPDGNLFGSGGGVGTINYATGTIIINGAGANSLTGTFWYYPGLPVLGLEDYAPNLVSASSSPKFPLDLAFDDTYAYQLNQTGAPFYNSVSYYKLTNNPVVWSNDDSNQFWTTNYQSAFWATNNKPGFHYVNATYISGSGNNIITFTFTTGGVPLNNLIVGDIVWFNEWTPPQATITAINKGTSTLTAANSFVIGQKVTFKNVQGMTQLNQGIYTITAASGTNFTITPSTATFSDYIGGGTAILVPSNDANTLNGVNGFVSTVSNASTGTYIITFTDNLKPTGNAEPQTVSGTGIGVLLTNSLPSSGLGVVQDGIRFYDGDPTQGTGLPTADGTGVGWVNFSPPLTNLVVSINGQVQNKYYLVGALSIVPFKDRLLFFGPQIQAVGGTVIQLPLQDTVIYSWNGTPFYNSLVPTNANLTETYDSAAYYVDQTGFGGYQSAGLSLPIVTVVDNQDVLLVGFGGQGKKTRLVYTGNDLQPFLFYIINSEMPSSCTYSAVKFDRGAIEIGQYGLTITSQQNCERIDVDIPDEIFKIQSKNFGTNRVNAVRDFYREWVYFTYPTGDGVASSQSWVYPTRSLLYNYIDNTWAVLRENYTSQGTFRRANKYTWQTLPFKTWDTWREPWNAGSTTALFPSIIAGNPEGYVIVKGEGTGEAFTGYISALQNDGNGYTLVTAINHCVNSQSGFSGITGDYLYFGGQIGLVINVIDSDNFVVDIPYPLTAIITNIVKGSVTVVTANNTFFIGQTVTIATVVGMTQLNGNTYTVIAATATAFTLNVNSSAFTTYVSGGTATLFSYVGTGQYARLTQPLIQTKQFPIYWEQGYKCRLGVQKYLLDKTANGQITVNINLSQDPDTIWNLGPIQPNNNVTNNSLEYSQLVYTCTESTNLGLTPLNINLQMPTAFSQEQIWHRLNTSLIGDTVQLGFTLNDAQMRVLQYATSEITLSGIHLTLYRSQQLA
jgi:hypothetical protein